LSSPNHYKILGLEPSATQAQIKERYKQLAKRFHPDVLGDQSAEGVDFAQINQAYSVLIDPKSRRQYDFILDQEAYLLAENESKTRKKRKFFWRSAFYLCVLLLVSLAIYLKPSYDKVSEKNEDQLLVQSLKKIEETAGFFSYFLSLSPEQQKKVPPLFWHEWAKSLNQSLLDEPCTQTEELSFLLKHIPLQFAPQSLLYFWIHCQEKTTNKPATDADFEIWYQLSERFDHFSAMQIAQFDLMRNSNLPEKAFLLFEQIRQKPWFQELAVDQQMRMYLLAHHYYQVRQDVQMATAMYLVAQEFFEQKVCNDSLSKVFLAIP